MYWSVRLRCNSIYQYNQTSQTAPFPYQLVPVYLLFLVALPFFLNLFKIVIAAAVAKEIKINTYLTIKSDREAPLQL